MTPEEVVQGGHRAMAVIEGTLIYKLRIVSGILQGSELDQGWRQVYEMLATMIRNFLDPVRAELELCDIMWHKRMGKVTELQRIGEIIFPTPIVFTGEITAAGKALNDYTLQDRSLEGLADPARFAAIHNACVSDMTIASCSGFWYDEQMRLWWSGLQEYEQTSRRKLWNTWRRAVAGGHRQVTIGRACFPDAAGFYWRLQGKGVQTTTSRNEADFDQAYNYYQEAEQKPLVCYDGPYILDTGDLTAGDADLEETSPFDIADTDPG